MDNLSSADNDLVKVQSLDNIVNEIRQVSYFPLSSQSLSIDSR